MFKHSLSICDSGIDSALSHVAMGLPDLRGKHNNRGSTVIVCTVLDAGMRTSLNEIYAFLYRLYSCITSVNILLTTLCPSANALFKKFQRNLQHFHSWSNIFMSWKTVDVHLKCSECFETQKEVCCCRIQGSEELKQGVFFTNNVCKTVFKHTLSIGDSWVDSALSPFEWIRILDMWYFIAWLNVNVTSFVWILINFSCRNNFNLSSITYSLNRNVNIKIVFTHTSDAVRA